MKPHDRADAGLAGDAKLAALPAHQLIAVGKAEAEIHFSAALGREERFRHFAQMRLVDARAGISDFDRAAAPAAENRRRSRRRPVASRRSRFAARYGSLPSFARDPPSATASSSSRAAAAMPRSPVCPAMGRELAPNQLGQRCFPNLQAQLLRPLMDAADHRFDVHGRPRSRRARSARSSSCSPASRAIFSVKSLILPMSFLMAWFSIAVPLVIARSE